MSVTIGMEGPRAMAQVDRGTFVLVICGCSLAWTKSPKPSWKSEKSAMGRPDNRAFQLIFLETPSRGGKRLWSWMCCLALALVIKRAKR